MTPKPNLFNDPLDQCDKIWRFSKVLGEIFVSEVAQM